MATHRLRESQKSFKSSVILKRRPLQKNRVFTAQVAEALEEEKRRQAQFLHDEVGPLAVRVLMDIDWIGAREGKDKNGDATSYQISSAELKDLRDGVVRLLNAIRGQSHELLPTVLDEAHLPSALEWLAHLYQRKSGICCVVQCSSGPLTAALSKEEITSLFRISQEALCNVWKHASATKVTISLSESPEGISLKITDNGTGMPSAIDILKPHLGMRSMKARTAMIGGEFSVLSSPKTGTEVRVYLPADRLLHVA